MKQAILGEQVTRGLAFVFKYSTQEHEDNPQGSFNWNHISNQCTLPSVLEMWRSKVSASLASSAHIRHLSVVSQWPSALPSGGSGLRVISANNNTVLEKSSSQWQKYSSYHKVSSGNPTNIADFLLQSALLQPTLEHTTFSLSQQNHIFKSISGLYPEFGIIQGNWIQYLLLLRDIISMSKLSVICKAAYLWRLNIAQSKTQFLKCNFLLSHLYSQRTVPMSVELCVCKAMPCRHFKMLDHKRFLRVLLTGKFYKRKKKIPGDILSDLWASFTSKLKRIGFIWSIILIL